MWVTEKFFFCVCGIGSTDLRKDKKYLCKVAGTFLGQNWLKHSIFDKQQCELMQEIT